MLSPGKSPWTTWSSAGNPVLEVPDSIGIQGSRTAGTISGPAVHRYSITGGKMVSGWGDGSTGDGEPIRRARVWRLHNRRPGYATYPQGRPREVDARSARHPDGGW